VGRYRLFPSLAMIGALAAALALAGCGRKGPLDLPPAAAATGEQQPASNGGQVQGGKPAAAAKQPKKHFLLDPLLN